MNTLMAAALLIVTLPVSPSAQPQPAPESLLVSTSWLADHLQDRDVVILWTGAAGSASEFIPGTHVVPHETVMTSQGGHDLLPTEQLAAVPRKAGVINAGLDVGNYVGSWSDWKGRGLPTEP
jgi:3-mercaptopyruvate sulfurtransferase SseA